MLITDTTVSVTKIFKPMIFGGVLAGVTILSVTLFPTDKAIDLLAMLLAIIGAIYIGFALSDRRQKELWIELAAAAVTISLAVAGLWVSPGFLVIGYMFHGAWDIGHHPRLIQTRIVGWYPPACVVYDWIIAAFILVWWSGNFFQ
jgi:hypothetical protein